MDIVYADEALAALWETSAAAKQELADQLPIVRRAVRVPSPLPDQDTCSVIRDHALPMPCSSWRTLLAALLNPACLAYIAS